MDAQRLGQLAFVQAVDDVEAVVDIVELLADDAGRAQLTAIYDSLNVVHRLHEGELAKALGIQLGFNANDGD